MQKEFYRFSAADIMGKEINMKEFEGKLVLVVNTASKCGFTPQYEGLQKLYEKYSEKGLVILGFPCNQFGAQEPGDEQEIVSNCLANYGVTFPMFSKIDVNGDGTHPIFKFLKKALPGTLGEKIKWNFTKFLISRDGTPLKRYAPMTTPDQIEKDIEKLAG